MRNSKYQIWEKIMDLIGACWFGVALRQLNGGMSSLLDTCGSRILSPYVN